MKIAIIGSGHAALSTAEGLIERGVKPLILDVGEILPEAIQTRVDALARATPETWPEGAERFPAPRQKTKLPQKTVFGSDYIYAKNNPFAPVHQNGTTASPSFAKGGFSMGWGGAVLPARPEDLKAWPFGADRLDAHYAKALKSMPLTGRPDRLSDAFPLHHDAPCAMAPTGQGARLLQDLERAEKALNTGRDRVLFGTARLAVDGQHCRKCSMCLTGCPYGLIYTLDKALEQLVSTNKVHYQSGAYVVSLEEKSHGVTVNWIETATGVRHSDTFERVFVGAGALSTTRLVLNSLKAYDQPVTVQDSAKFAIPMVRLPASPLEWPATNTLADLFIEAVLPDISDHWLHIQVSPLNHMMLQALHMHDDAKGRALNGLGRLAKPLLRRMMVAWCALHSELSSTCEVRVTPGDDGLPILNVSTGLMRPAYVRTYGRKLARMGLKFATGFATPATMISPPCSTGHCGGSFPMREHPQGPFETDTLGRLTGWQRIHLVDPSAFPSIPGTTIALLIRANARRIVAEMKLESAP